MAPIDSLFPRKSLGQNFLVNTDICERIIDLCALTQSDTVLEIGPGKGALTRGLANKAGTVIAVEKDKKLAQRLIQEFEHTHVTVITGDILKYPFESLPGRLKVVGNLPYNIVTPIISKIFRHRNKFRDLYLTVQLEYGQRITAPVNSQHYSAFSCFVQFYADTQILLKIGRSAFHPVPKVQSCFMRLRLLDTPRYGVSDEELLFRIIRTCFQQRRKTIHNSLSGILPRDKIPAMLESLNINPKLRAENIGLENYVRIVKAVAKYR